MIRNQIIQTAKALFTRNGIDAVNMEKIAIAAGVSEKDMYTEFDGKGQLIEECLNYEITEMNASISTTKTLSQSTLELFILVMYVVLKTSSGFCPLFYKDLSKYPAIYKRWTIFNLKFQDECTGYFRQCMEEGYFKSYEDNQRMALIYIEEISSLASKYQSTMIQTLLKGISTPKGINELNRIATIIEIKINKIETIKSLQSK